jgi:hypothetical protein
MAFGVMGGMYRAEEDLGIASRPLMPMKRHRLYATPGPHPGAHVGKRPPLLDDTAAYPDSGFTGTSFTRDSLHRARSVGLLFGRLECTSCLTISV